MEEQIKNLLSQEGNIPSDFIVKARQFMNTKQGKEMIKQLNDQGINPDMLAKLIGRKPNQAVVVIRNNGIMKSKLSNDNYKETFSTSYVTVIDDILVTAWYDDKNKFLNKKASKILNHDVYGQVILEGIAISMLK